MATEIKPLQLIPPGVLHDAAQSRLFMKQLTKVALSNILFTRRLCSEECFQTLQFNNFNLKVLADNSKNEHAKFFNFALESTFEALDKEYLASLVVCFYEEDDSVPENLIECYMFQYSYAPDGTQFKFSSEKSDCTKSIDTRGDLEKIEQQTLTLLQSLLVVDQSSSSLPKSVQISFLAHYNDKAPRGYQAPNFTLTSSKTDYIDKWIEDAERLGVSKQRRRRLRLGVDTPFHQLTSYWCMSDTWIKKKNQCSEVSSNLKKPGDIITTSKTPAPRKLACVCNENKTENCQSRAIIICIYCGKGSHAACYGVRQAAAGRVSHCCVTCAGHRGCTPTDPSLLRKPPTFNIKSLCIYRRTLDWCNDAVRNGKQAVTPHHLMTELHISEADAFKVLRQLDFKRVITQHGELGLETACPIETDRLKILIEKEFAPIDSSNSFPIDSPPWQSVSQLAQLSRTEPKDMELTNVSPFSMTTGRVIENSQTEMSASQPNTLMKMYSEAVSSQEVDDDNLPLSGSHNPLSSQKKRVRFLDEKNEQKTAVKPKTPKRKRVTEEYAAFLKRMKT